MKEDYPPRPEPGDPPEEITPTESRYVEQLFRAYAEHTKQLITDR